MTAAVKRSTPMIVTSTSDICSRRSSITEVFFHGINTSRQKASPVRNVIYFSSRAFSAASSGFAHQFLGENAKGLGRVLTLPSVRFFKPHAHSSTVSGDELNPGIFQCHSD